MKVNVVGGEIRYVPSILACPTQEYIEMGGLSSVGSVHEL